MKEGYDQYFLTDTQSGRTNPDSEVMLEQEKRDRNEFLERQNSRHRWMTKQDLEALNA